jgi:acetolactate synthase I/II/III large subunit
VSEPTTVAAVLASALAAAGVERIYGIPGGGTTAMIVEAEARGIRFVLTHGETAAALMAATDAERSNVPGVVVTSSGPGAAAVVDGIAHARLDRAPVLLLTDRQPDRSNAEGYHQWLDQAGLFASVAKASLTVTAAHVATTMAHAVALAHADPPGPVHVDVPIGVGRRSATAAPLAPLPPPGRPRLALPDDVLGRIAAARRPLILAGLGARELSPGLLDTVAADLGAPVLATYKGKGAVDETSPWAAGVLIAGGPERDHLERADLVVSVGLDAVELFPSVPPLDGRRIALDAYQPTPGVLAPPLHQAIGDLDHLVRQLPTSGSSEWNQQEVVAGRRAMEGRLAAAPSGERGGLHPWAVARTIDEACSEDADIAVDAGAHMLPIAQAWKTRRPGAFVISNGLATMGFGLPAAIARSIADPQRHVVCCTGDGGLLMVAGELATAAREGHRLTIVVFDDRSLSLIRVKQVGAEAGRGVDIAGPAWDELARAFGIPSTVVGDLDGLRSALTAASDQGSPQLIVVPTDPAPYAGIITELRG